LPTVVAGAIASGVALVVKSMAGVSGFAGLVVIGASWVTVFLAAAFLFRLDALAEARGMLVRNSWTVEES
jgi:hypothetical protein